MPAVFEYRVSAQTDDADLVGHVNNVVYLRWLQDAAIAHSTAQGWSSAAYVSHGSGWVARSHLIEYLGPAFPGDELIIRTWVADLKRVTSRRRYVIFRSGQPVVRAETQWAFVSFSTLQPCRIPSVVASAFEIPQPEPPWEAAVVLQETRS
ncbi:MAG: acyl-CoA thioesterase [Planctomycetota bacterium]